MFYKERLKPPCYRRKHPETCHSNIRKFTPVHHSCRHLMTLVLCVTAVHGVLPCTQHRASRGQRSEHTGIACPPGVRIAVGKTG